MLYDHDSHRQWNMEQRWIGLHISIRLGPPSCLTSSTQFSRRHLPLELLHRISFLPSNLELILLLARTESPYYKTTRHVFDAYSFSIQAIDAYCVTKTTNSVLRDHVVLCKPLSCKDKVAADHREILLFYINAQTIKYSFYVYAFIKAIHKAVIVPFQVSSYGVSFRNK